MKSTKLTLSIPENLLLEAKVYSKKTHQPLSRLVSRYFLALSKSLKPSRQEDKISLRVKKITGLAKSHKSEEDILFESLSKKYS